MILEISGRVPASRSIILVGMMGCGKTTVGKELSKVLCLPLLDMDAVIEEQIGKPIPDIFKDEGEAHFRALETALLQYLESFPENNLPAVISTGGGVVTRPENREILRRLGFVVWLDVDVRTLASRTSRATNRPLLKNVSRVATLRKLSEARAPMYQEVAHLRLRSSKMELHDIVRRIAAEAQIFFGS